MPLEPLFPKRKPLRLKGYDYSQAGAYLVTVCVHERTCLFGQITEGQMLLNANGRVVEAEWLQTGRIRPNVTLDLFTVMPNHFHAILFIDYADLGVRGTNEPRQCLDRIMAGFKSTCTRRIRELKLEPALILWQRGCHDEIIRNEQHLYNARAYIQNNPAEWESDPER